MVAAVDIDVLFRRAFTASTHTDKNLALKQITEKVGSTSLYPSTTKDAIQAIESSMNDFISIVTNYTSPALLTPQFCALLTMCICMDIYLAGLFILDVKKDSNWRIGITVPMGGASTLGICLAALTNLFTGWKDEGISDVTIKIQESWKHIFSCPQEKAYLVKLLSSYWISKNLGTSKNGISLLKKAFAESKDLSTLHAKLLPLTAATTN